MQNVTTLVDPRHSKRHKPARWRRHLVWYALIAPNVILFAIFGLLPIVATVLISFTRWNILGSPSWIGLQNFQRLLHDAEFWTSLRVTLVYALLFVIPSAGIALGQALLISLAGRWQACRGAPSSRRSIRLPVRIRCFRTKCSTSTGMSSRLLRSGGISMGMTLSR